jgi:hypothetical protein
LEKTALKIEKVEYGGWKDCARMSNGLVDLVVVTAVGPRILRFGFVGGRNEFHEFPETLGKTGGKDFRSYGGHRFWVAPELRSKTYFPDNRPVETAVKGDTLMLTAPVEESTGLQKVLSVTLHPGQPSVTVVHHLRNVGKKDLVESPWAVSVMSPGGVAVLPVPDPPGDPEHLESAYALASWSWTNLSDPRLVFGRKFIRLRQDARLPESLKIGLSALDGWAAYWNAGHLFVDRFTHDQAATYPDRGSSTEIYADGNFLEVESLGPLVKLAPGGSVSHREDWFLYQDVPAASDDAGIESHFLPLVKRSKP